MNDTDQDNGVRFSMKSLMILITIVCGVLALPGGHELIAVMCIWSVLVAAVASLLIIFSKTINRLIAGSHKRRQAKQATNGSANHQEAS